MAIVLDPRELTDLGAFLRDGRERRGLTLDQVASATRLPRRHLDALEHGDLTVLPSGMYRRAEVRAFADAVGLDRNVALAHLEQALDHHAPPEPAGRLPALEAPRRQWGAYAALAVFATAALAVATRGQWTPQAPPVERTREIVAPAASGPARVVTPAAPEPTPGLTAPPSTPPKKAATVAATGDAGAKTALPVAPPVSPPVALPIETVLVVTSTPAGARVLVDGIGWGQTPLTIRNLAPGDRRLRVVLDGFVSAERRVRIAPGRGNLTAHVDLRAAN